jgi:molybdenum cofactor cytidylyltransferase
LRRTGAEGRERRPLIAGILLAAGRSSRFGGRQKLLQPWQGEPLVRRAARGLIDSNLAPVVAVVSSDPRFAEALANLPLTMVQNPEPEHGISQSIAIGVGALPAASEAVLIAVADQPYLSSDALGQLIRAFSPGRIVVPRYGNHRGNPPVFDRRFFPELLRLRGDRGGQVVIAAHPEAVSEVSLLATMGDDIDRPEQWPG